MKQLKELNEYLEEFDYSQQTDGKIRTSKDLIPPEFPSNFRPHGVETVENDASGKAEKISISPENDFSSDQQPTAEERAKMFEDGDF